MTRVIFILLYVSLTAIIIAYIDNGIRTHDMNFYHGKDNGYIERFESILILNTIFFILMKVSKKQTFIGYAKHGILGFLTAIIISVVSYLIFLRADYYGLTFHIATIILCYSSYFWLNKLKPVIT